MSIFRRLSIVIKSYVSAAGSRVERIAAEEELREAKARQKALEDLRALDTEPLHSVGRRSAAPPPRPHRLAADYRLLGLAPGVDLAAVEAAWRKLAERADPKRFPIGSDEERRAAQILNSINEAYARIREELHPTEGRFGQLEL